MSAMWLSGVGEGSFLQHVCTAVCVKNTAPHYQRVYSAGLPFPDAGDDISFRQHTSHRHGAAQRHFWRLRLNTFVCETSVAPSSPAVPRPRPPPPLRPSPPRAVFVQPALLFVGSPKTASSHLCCYRRMTTFTSSFFFWFLLDRHNLHLFPCLLVESWIWGLGERWPPTGLCLTLHPDGQKAC